MKPIYLTFFFFYFLSGTAQNIAFPDAAFKSKLVNSNASNEIAKDLNGNYFAVDADGDGEIRESEAMQVSMLNLTSCSISDFEGIAFFQNLEELDCTNSGVSHSPVSLDISGLTHLKKLICQDNTLTLGIGSFSHVEYLDLDYCHDLTTLDFTGFDHLKFLSCSQTDIVSLNVEGLNHLEYLDCGNFNQFSNINLSSLESLKVLICNSTAVTSIDASGLNNLEELYIRDNANLTTLSLDGCSNLKILDCEGSQLTALNVSNLSHLEELYCSSNAITSFNISDCHNLKKVDCSGNFIPTLNLTGLPNLQYLYCYHNQLTELEANTATNLIELFCDHNQMNYLNVANLTQLKKLHCEFNQLPLLNANYLNSIEALYCDHNEINSLYIKNGVDEQTLVMSSNPITYICADPSQMTSLQPYIDAHPDCALDASCSLTISDFETVTALTVSPNPAKESLNLNTKNQIQSIEIYNLLGQLVLSVKNIQHPAIDISGLRTGNYFVRAITDHGNLTQQFIKE